MLREYGSESFPHRYLVFNVGDDGAMAFLRQPEEHRCAAQYSGRQRRLNGGPMGGSRHTPCLSSVLGECSVEQYPNRWRAPMADLLNRITINPDQCGGRPCIRGMRIRVIDVLDLLAAGLSREQVLEELPDLEPEDVSAALRYASRRLDHPVLAA
jgi:uncharacterized protein (DUF433 family)